MDTQPITTDQQNLPVGADYHPPASPAIPTVVEGSKSSSHYLPIILSSLITIIVLVGAYFLFLNKKTQPIATTPPSSPTASAVSVVLSVDPTSTWQTYSNEKMNLSLKYPSDKNLKVFASEYNDPNFAINTAQYDPIYFAVAYLPTSELQDWYRKAYSSTQQEQEKAPELQKGPDVDGHASYQSDFNIEVVGKIRYIFIQADKGIYQINMPLSSNTTQYQILSTFKFTN